jgi:predicted exporter
MDPARLKWTARALLLLGALGGVLCLWHLDLGQRISTDVLDLVPADERFPELAMVRGLAGQDEARMLLLALRVPRGAGEAEASYEERGGRLAAAFARGLGRSPAIAEALTLADTGPRNDLAGAVFADRLELLLPGWIESKRREYGSSGSAAAWSPWLAERAAADLEAYLARPEALAAQDILTSDPLLLVPGLAARLSGIPGAGGAEGRSGEYWLVWARTRDSPLSEAGQQPVFDSVDGALAEARRAEPAVELRWAGIARFAAASRQRIQHEVAILNLLSLAVVALVTVACVRRPYRAAQLVPVILGSLLGAWVVTAACWAHLHVLVFVLGSLLSGVAVDYGFYLYLQPRAHPDETYPERAGRLLRPLLASALTTVIGFSILLWSELPLIRQLGVFVSAGLLCALATALLWFAQVRDPHLAARDLVGRRLPAGSAGGRVAARLLLAAGAAVALAGPWRLQWRDDIRELEIPEPALRSNDSFVRSLFGQSPGRSVYLTRGATLSAARSNLESLAAWHESRFPGATLVGLGQVLPTEDQLRALEGQLSALGSFEGELRAALGRHGFDPASFAPFFEAWRAEMAAAPGASFDAAAARVLASLRGPLAALVHRDSSLCWFVSTSEDGASAEPPAATSTVTDSQLQNLNRLFSRYRLSALKLSTIGLGIVGASVLALYGLRRGPRIFAIPAGACLFAFGVFGLAGSTLNLFNLLGAFLGVCLSHNYAIFTAESELRGEEPPPSIRMSALAAAGSFGVLAVSRIPVVAALGSTVALIVLSALAITELAPLARATPRAQAPSTTARVKPS